MAGDDEATLRAIERQLGEVETSSYVGLDPLQQLTELRAAGLAASAADRLKVFQALRAAQAEDPDQIFFTSVVWMLDRIADDEIFTTGSPELAAIDEELDRIRTAHGVGDDEDWPGGATPPAFADANRRWEEEFERLRAEVWARFDEPMAELLRTDPEQVARRFEVGRLATFGPRPDVSQAPDEP